MELFKREPQNAAAGLVVRIVAIAAGAAAGVVFLNDQQIAETCKTAGAGLTIGEPGCTPVFLQVAVPPDGTFAVIGHRKVRAAACVKRRDRDSVVEAAGTGAVGDNRAVADRIEIKRNRPRMGPKCECERKCCAAGNQGGGDQSKHIGALSLSNSNHACFPVIIRENAYTQYNKFRTRRNE